MKITNIEKRGGNIEITFGVDGHYFTKEFSNRAEVKLFVSSQLTPSVKMALCLRMALTSNMDETRAARVLGKTLSFNDTNSTVTLS